MVSIRENISLRPFHTFGIDTAARYFSSFQTTDELKEALDFGLPADIRRNLLILGGGSNILFTGDYNGLVLKNELKGIDVVSESDMNIDIRVGAGENWHAFVRFCVDNDYSGIENLSLIPGNVGASPMQNIGAYGVEIKDVFQSLEALDIKEKSIRTFSREECAFGYRESVFKKALKNQFVITSVTYRLKKKPEFNTSYGAIQQELERMGIQELSIRAVSDAVIRIRSSKLPDPGEVGNAGSFFKNPMVPLEHFKVLQQEFPRIPSFPADEYSVKVPAGWLIEQCGWKGYRKADAGCYAKQALVLVNYGNATGKEIYDLSEEILVSVREKFGVTLEREVNIL